MARLSAAAEAAVLSAAHVGAAWLNQHVRQISQRLELDGVVGRVRRRLGLDGVVGRIRRWLGLDEVVWRVRRRLGLDGAVGRIRRRLGLDGVMEWARWGRWAVLSFGGPRGRY